MIQGIRKHFSNQKSNYITIAVILLFATYLNIKNTASTQYALSLGHYENLTTTFFQQRLLMKRLLKTDLDAESALHLRNLIPNKRPSGTPTTESISTIKKWLLIADSELSRNTQLINNAALSVDYEKEITKLLSAFLRYNSEADRYNSYNQRPLVSMINTGYAPLPSSKTPSPLLSDFLLVY